MAFREVAMFEIKEVIRLFGKGVPKKNIALAVGVDVKTVRTYLAAAEPLGLAGLYRFAAEQLEFGSRRRH